MATEQPTTKTTPSPLSDGSGSDFSILPRQGSGLVGPGDSTGGEQVDLAHLHFSLGALASLAVDGTIEEAVRIIEQLMRENEELKESVQESNSLMRQQYQYLEDWRGKNSSEQTFMKKKYQQIKAYVLDLKQRIKDKDAQIENLKAQVKQHEDQGSQVETALLHGQLEEFKTKVSQLEQEMVESNEASAKMSHELYESKLKASELEAQKMEVKQQLEHSLREREESKDENKRITEAFHKILLEKEDLLALNNELMAKTNGGNGDTEYVVVKTDKEGGANSVAESPMVEQAKRRGELVLTPSLTRHDQAVSDLLIQLQAERTKVCTLSGINNQQNLQVQKLQRELMERERRISESSSKINTQVSQVEAEWRSKVDQLMQQLELVNRELNETRDAAACAEVQHLKAQVMTLVQELQETQKEQENALNTLTQHRDKCREMESRATMYQEQLDAQRAKDDQLIETLRMSIINLESELKKTRALLDSKSHNMTELTKNFDQLCTDYHELLDDYEEYRAQQESRGQAAGTVTLTKEAMEKLDNQMAQLMLAEETLAEKDERIEDLRQEIAKKDEMAQILTAQAELYKVDFEAERSARENKHEEKEQYKAQCDQLRIQIAQLQQELNSITNQQLQHMRQRHTLNRVPPVQVPTTGVVGPPGTGQYRPGYDYPAGREQQDVDPYAAAARPQSPHVQHYVCPSCNNQFPDEDSLRIHIEDCLAP